MEGEGQGEVEKFTYFHSFTELNTKVCNLIVLFILLLAFSQGVLANTSFDGLFEVRYGIREHNTPGQKRATIGEAKIQFNSEAETEELAFNLSVDLKADTVESGDDINLRTGEGEVDLRQLNFLFYPSDTTDIKIGRQILTWGTADLLFINDLFPKDFRSFFIGRADGYLKAPSDAIKISFFPDFANFDFVYTPRFNADRFVTGERLTFYDPLLQDFRNSDNPLAIIRLDDWIKEDEIAMRMTKNIGGLETALYYYSGYWKSPSLFDTEADSWSFSELEVTGASIRTSYAGGVVNLEIGRYKSDSLSKNNPLSRNSEFRFLVGFEKELFSELTASLQLYSEKKLNYQSYTNSLPENGVVQPKYRNLYSLMLTKLLFQQNLTLSLVNIYSFTEEDGYLKLSASYKFSDRLKGDIGVNRFIGSGEKGSFSSLKKNNNVYLGMSYSF